MKIGTFLHSLLAGAEIPQVERSCPLLMHPREHVDLQQSNCFLALGEYLHSRLPPPLNGWVMLPISMQGHSPPKILPQLPCFSVSTRERIEHFQKVHILFTHFPLRTDFSQILFVSNTKPNKSSRKQAKSGYFLPVSRARSS